MHALELVVAEKNLKGLLLHTLKDVYFAEHEILKALPKWRRQPSGRAEEGVRDSSCADRAADRRLNDVFALLNEKPQGVPCKAIQGILAEGQEVMEEFAGGPALDAGLIAAAQAVEHYEIARYGALRSWAELASLDDAADLLDETLEEEKRPTPC